MGEKVPAQDEVQVLRQFDQVQKKVQGLQAQQTKSEVGT